MKSSNYLRQAKRRGHRRNDTESDSDSDSTFKEKVVGKYQLSLLLDINRAQLDAWIKQGMPIVREGGVNKEWEFDLVAIRIWAHNQGYLTD